MGEVGWGGLPLPRSPTSTSRAARKAPSLSVAAHQKSAEGKTQQPRGTGGLGIRIITSTSQGKRSQMQEARQAGGWCSREERGADQVPGGLGNATSGHP